MTTPKSIPLSASQRAILEAAAARADGAIYPLRPKLKGVAAERLLTVLVSNKLAVQGEGANDLRITNAGRRAIDAPKAPALPAEPEPAHTAPVPPATKQDVLIALLRRPEGATLEQMMAATGWLRHSVRGAISAGLRKKLGLRVVTERLPERVTLYRIEPAMT